MVTFTCPKVSFSYISFYLGVGPNPYYCSAHARMAREANPNSALRKEAWSKSREDWQIRRRPIISSSQWKLKANKYIWDVARLTIMCFVGSYTFFCKIISENQSRRSVCRTQTPNYIVESLK